MNEHEIALAISTGQLPSPQVVGNAVLFAMRITGTGAAYREKLNEYTFRNPANYLNDGGLELCSGAPVIFNHPDGNVLTNDNYKAHIVGTIIYPYLQDSEIWGVAKILDTDAAIAIIDDNLSTSPTFILSTDNQKKITLDDMTVLIEDKPEQLDHVAICADGVWDKGETPNGILNNNEDLIMADEDLKANADDEAKKIAAYADIPAVTPETTLKTVAADADSVTISNADLEALLKLADMQQTLSEQQAHELAELKARISGTESDLAAKADAAETGGLADRLSTIEGRMKEPEELKDEDVAEVADAEQEAEKVTQAFGDSAKHAMKGEKPAAYKRRIAKLYQKNSVTFADSNLDVVLDKNMLNLAFKTICADSVHAAEVMPRNNGRGVWVTETRGGRTIESVKGMSDDAAFSEFRIKARAGELTQRGNI
jgi:hypothetical protein